MRYVCLLVVVHACVGVAQDRDPAGVESSAAIVAEMHGVAISEPRADPLAHRPGGNLAPPDKAQAIWSYLNLPAAPYTNQKELAGVESVKRLSHKIPKPALKSFERAWTLSKNGKHEEAIRELTKAIAIDPDFAEAYNNLGVQYYLLKRPSDAQPLLRRAIELDPAAAPSYANLAAVALALGDSAGAELLARRALTLAPRNASAQGVLDVLHHKTGHEASARP
jgi:tetratricopeptide (TPR) repeat protein